MLFVIFLLCAPFLLGGVSPMHSSRELEGYAAGYLAECPGVTKPTIISDRSLKRLTITVSGIKPNVQNKRKKYNYFQIKEMAKDPTMDYSKKTAMYIGGFLDSPNFPFAKTLETYYRRLGYNVWLLDVNFFTTREYPAAARTMRAVGNYVGEIIGNMTLLAGLDPKRFEILGLSLGGQTMAFVAKRYKQLTGVRFGNLVALDPSGLCFRSLGPNDRLDTEDADFIQQILTSMDTSGMPMPVGHVNFYVNGGETQAGQSLWSFCDDLCAHFRAYNIWLAALENPHGFIGIKCNTPQEARDKNCYDIKPRVTNNMGLQVDKTKQGIFYLPSKHRYPYVLGVRGLKKDVDTMNAEARRVNFKDILID